MVFFLMLEATKQVVFLRSSQFREIKQRIKRDPWMFKVNQKIKRVGNRTGLIINTKMT